MFKELFTESTDKRLWLKIGDKYHTQNNFIVEITKEMGLKSMGIKLFDAVIISGPGNNMIGKTKRYNEFGQADGMQKQSSKHDQWSLTKKVK